MNPILLIGTYSALAADALFLYGFNAGDGSLQLRYSIPVPSASYAAMSQSGMLYAVSETDTEHSTVTSLRLYRDSAQIVNKVRVHADSPCHIAVSPDDRFLATANYGDGTATIFPILPSGALGEAYRKLQFSGQGPVQGRQNGSHPHCISFSADGKFMFVNDLGLDRIHKFRIFDDSPFFVGESSDEDIVLNPASGPRHIIYNRDNTLAYLINEISDEVTILSVDADTLVPLSSISSPLAGGKGAGDIQLSPEGNNLYVSLRLKNDGISLFSVDPSSGLLTYKSHTFTGRHPRTFTISPDGRWLVVACKDNNSVEVYSLSPTDGTLEFHSRIQIDSPAFVKFL